MAHTVLIVEDSRLVSDLVAESLQAKGFLCRQAFDGARALMEFERTEPDAVVLDLNIPKVHGLEVLRRVKSRRPYAVVVVLTGHGSEQTAMQALKLGADDYFTKPCRTPDLVEALQVHLRRADLQNCLDIPGTCPSELGERHLAQLFFEAPAAMVHVDAEGILRAVNRSAARLLTRNPTSLLGEPAANLAVPEIRRHWFENVRRAATAPPGYAGEVFLEGVAGPFSAEVTVVEGPEPGHLILAFRDLTHQKAMEERYFESKKLASLGRVVEGVAHEVRNPIISIGGFARKLHGVFPGVSREARYAEVIVAEVERLEQMVRDIEEYVAFSRRERPAFHSVAVAEVLHRVLAEVADRLRSGGVRVDEEIRTDLPGIYGDAALLEELFRGLVENAGEAMPEGGDLSVQTETDEDWVQIRVADTGRGIPAEDLEEIFDPFFTSKTAGAGLGLAKAYLIVEEHAGTIDFESRVGRGTLCTVNLPVDRRRVPRAV